MNNHPTLPHILHIAAQQYAVRDLVDASHAYLLARDRASDGVTPFAEGTVAIGNHHYRITHDGRVWLGGECIVEPQ